METTLAKIEGDEIVIRISIAALPGAVAHAQLGRDPEPVTIDDLNQYAAEFVRELNYEDDCGDTPVHDLLDGIVQLTVENGALGLSL